MTEQWQAQGFRSFVAAHIYGVSEKSMTLMPRRRNLIHGSDEIKLPMLWPQTDDITTQWHCVGLQITSSEPIGKKNIYIYKYIYQVNDTSINDINSLFVKINLQIITPFLKELYLFRLLDYHARSAIASFYTQRRGYSEAVILLKMIGWTFPMCSQLCWMICIS